MQPGGPVGAAAHVFSKQSAIAMRVWRGAAESDDVSGYFPCCDGEVKHEKHNLEGKAAAGQ